MANGPLRITGGPFDPELYKSEHEVQDPELKVRKLGLLVSHTGNWYGSYIRGLLLKSSYLQNLQDYYL